MAEPNNITVEMNDPSYIPILCENNAEEINATLHTSDNMDQDMIDEILAESNSIEKESVDKLDDSVEEQHVESPTTREGYVFKCAFCDQVLTVSDNPKLLECLHNACNSCLNLRLYDSTYQAKNVVECSLCSLNTRSSKIIDNQFLLESTNTDEQTSKMDDLKCSSCSDDAVASSYCTDCSEFICDNCVQAHQRLKITKDHTIKPKEEGIMEANASSNGTNASLFCSNHPNEKLTLFCETCDKMTCRDCQLTEHRQHTYKFTNEIASDARKYIAEMLKDVGYKRALLASAMKVIEERQKLISEKKSAIVTEITQFVVKLTNTINVRGKELVSELTEVCEAKQSTLQEKKMALEQLSRMTDYCIDFTQNALDNGSDTALLSSKRHVTDHLMRIKSRRADIPNPEIPVRIHLALDNVPALIKVMTTIGMIVVDGRIYSPNNATSPPNALLRPDSPSPGHSQPPQQQSPIMQQQQQQQHPQQQQQQSSNYPQPQRTSAPPPPYSQYQTMTSSQFQQGIMNAQQINDNMRSNLNSALNPNHSSRLPNMNLQPMSQPQFNNMTHMNMSRMQQRIQMNRSGLPPRMQNAIGGVNHQQQQVSSSTHPQNMLSGRTNLRHLLQPNQNANNPVYIQTGPAQYQAIEPGLFQNRFSNPAAMCRPPQPPQGPVRALMPNRVAIQRAQFNGASASGGGVKWHTPQQNLAAFHHAGLNRSMMTLPGINDNFKITLRHQLQSDPKNQPATVTSTIPKTPSPNHVQGRSDPERNLDSLCEDSVKDLMATIAKLDSNGVQVLSEGRQKGGSPHVDSSTGDAGPSVKIKSETSESGKEDPNEDWCAVCMDGGELVCCDKCPKVFHQYCHIPNLRVEETDTWQCLLCLNFADIPEEGMRVGFETELRTRDKKVLERVILEMYCQYDPSLPFREVIGPEHVDYHAIIKQPIALDTIRQKLQWSAENHYTSIEHFIRDVRLMFRNAYTYNPEDSQVYTDAKTLEKFFDEQLEKLMPEYAYESFDEDSVQPPRKFRRVVND